MTALRRTCLLVLVCGGMVYGQKAGVDRLIPLNTHETLSDTARLEWVKHFATNSGPRTDAAVDVAMDASGYIYVTGKSEGPDSGRDYLTIKYDPLGQEVWRARYDGSAHQDDIPTALAIDAEGNVCVTGMSTEVGYSSTRYQFATVKYSASGLEQWVARYNGPGHERGTPAAIAMDAAGNVYVTGKIDRWDSTFTGRYWNAYFATIKYSPDGVQQWATSYDGPAFSDDVATALAVDDSGSVFVGGRSNRYSVKDFVVVKYNSDGVTRWTEILLTDSVGWQWGEVLGEVIGVVADNTGGVYVAGYIGNWGDYPKRSILTARLNASGGNMWFRRFQDPEGAFCKANSLVVDHSGNAIVAGIIGTEYYWWYGEGKVLTLKYSPTGNLLWNSLYVDYDGTDPTMKVSDVGVDDAGNIYVAASSGRVWNPNEPGPLSRTIFALKYDPNGAIQWVQRFDGVAGSKNTSSAIAVSHDGSIAVVGGSGPTGKSNFVTIKYQSSGNREWDARTSGEGTSFESLTAMTVDASGNAYVTGSSIGAGTSSDYITAKFDPNGNMLWSARYDSPEHGHDYPSTIVVDNLGNVYVTGSSRKTDAAFSFVTVKYGSNGVQQWVGRYSPMLTWYTGWPYQLKVDGSGNVYVGGVTGLVKYDYSGIEQWGSVDTVCATALDRQNSLYISTRTRIIKIDSSGVRQTLLYTAGDDFAVDDSGNVYVTRLSWYPENQTQKYSPSGSLVWSLNRGGLNLCLDHSGNVLVKTYWTWNDTVAFKINRSGILEWSAVSVDWSGPIDFTVDESGNLYLSGIKNATLFGESDFYMVKYGSSGIQQWSARYNGPGNSSETPYGIGVVGAGAVYIAGVTQREDFSTKITLVKYSQVAVSVKEDQPDVPVNYSLSQNYPNPFNPVTNVQFSIANCQLAVLKVYDVLGREVATLVNEVKQPGRYSVQWDAGSVASGVYFYRLKAGEYSETKKLLLMK